MLTPDESPAYTTVIGCRCGKTFLLDIPAGAVKSPRETLGAFHRRVAVAVTELDSRSPLPCCRRGKTPTQTAAPACTGRAGCSPHPAPHQQ